jgi:hypothetical protein
MTIKLTLPSPRSVQSTVDPETKNQARNRLPFHDNYAFRLLTADGKLFRQLGKAEAIALFPATFNAFIASGKDRLCLHDIPERLLDNVLAALGSAGWYTKIRPYPDLSLAACTIAIPYTTGAYFTVPYLLWSSQPFPLTFEEKVWKWLKSWLF